MAFTLRPHPSGHRDDYSALHGQLEVGRISKRAVGARPGAEWLWVLNGLTGLPRELPVSGVSATHEEALTELNKSWATWLCWAKLKEQS
jgi:hypothetical protein